MERGESYKNFESFVCPAAPTEHLTDHSPRPVDISEDGVDITRTAETVAEGPDAFVSPENVAMKLFERHIEHQEYVHSDAGREDALRDELSHFGCSQTEMEDIISGMHEMRDQEGSGAVHGGDTARQWSVEKTDGGYHIKMEIKSVGVDDQQNSKENSIASPAEDNVLESKTGRDESSQDEHIGLTLENEVASADVGDVSYFQEERRDITDEEDPARRASRVLTQNPQNQNNNPE